MNKPRRITDPFAPIFTEPDAEITDDTALDLLNYAYQHEWHYTAGDYDLDESVFEIKCFQTAFVKLGLLAYKIKKYRCWSKRYSSFQDFCEKALGVKHWTINRTIEAARVMLELAQAGFTILPTCKTQCEPLWKIFSNFGTEGLIEAWQQVIDRLKPKMISKESISQVLGIERKKSKRQVLLEQLEEKAFKRGQTLEEFVEEILEEEEPSGETDPEKLAEWEADLENLVASEGQTKQLSLVSQIKENIFENLAMLSNMVSNHSLVKIIFSEVQFLT
jgi:hypothetical protein